MMILFLEMFWLKWDGNEEAINEKQNQISIPASDISISLMY